MKGPGQAGDGGVNAQVLSGTPGPAEIAAHRPLAQAAKDIGIILVQVHGLPDDVEHVAAGVVGEAKAIARVPPGFTGLNGVL